jgi:hypothetical protein
MVVQPFVDTLNLNVHFREALRAGTPSRSRTLLCYHGVLALHAGLGTLIVPRASAGLETQGLTGVLDGLFCG